MNMSFNLTVEPSRQFLKTVTRRDDSTWNQLEPLDVLQQVEKAQGLKRGEKVKKIHKIIIYDIRTEPLNLLVNDPEYGRREMILEGFPNLQPSEFVDMYCKANKCNPDKKVKRIAFRYLLKMGAGDVIKVPESIAVCPACKTQITIAPEGWEETKLTKTNNIWKCEYYSRWCATEPDVQDRKAFKDWENSHYHVNNSPYIYWLPIEDKIDQWVYKTFRFEE